MASGAIVLVTILGKFSRRTDKGSSLDTDEIRRDLERYGHAVDVLDILDVADRFERGALPPQASFVLMGHPDPTVRAYGSDLADALVAAGYVTIPAPLLLRAHENKGLQGWIAQNRHLAFVPQSYRFDDGTSEVHDRVVMKPISGAGSRGVRLVSSSADLARALRRDARRSIALQQIGRLAGLTLLRRFGVTKAMDRFRTERPRTRFVLQRFVPNRARDFKSLVFGHRVYVAQRDVRDGDFRASGSGRLSFPEPEAALLDLALATRRALNVPFVSLDIIETDDGYAVLEFQVVNFGPSVRDRASFAYQRSPHGWLRVRNDTTLEGDVASALHEAHAS
jgi:glutathione synthase/RimK-type ligase-like ATP-grasp enzyme